MSAPSIKRRQMYVCRRLYAVRGWPSRSKRSFSSSRMCFKELALPLGKNQIGRFGRAPLSGRNSGGLGRSHGRVRAINARRAEPASKSLKGQHRTRHTFAISNATLSPNLDLQDCLFQIVVLNDRDIPELQPPSLVGPQSGGSCARMAVATHKWGVSTA